MICCYELFLAWFCGYDVGTVLDMILIWIQLWFLMWVKIVIWSQPTETISKIVSKPYQNRMKSVSKSYQNRIRIISKTYQNHTNHRKKNLSLGCFFFLKPSHWKHIKNVSKPYQNRIKSVSKLYQHRIKIMSKRYQKHIKTTKTLEKSTKSLSLGCFCFFFWSQPVRNPEKALRSQTISKSHPKHAKTISKP